MSAKNKDILILNQIINHIIELKEFIDGYTYQTFEKDKKTINACVFSLSQIGELAGKVSEEIIKDNTRN